MVNVAIVWNNLGFCHGTNNVPRCKWGMKLFVPHWGTNSFIPHLQRAQRRREAPCQGGRRIPAAALTLRCPSPLGDGRFATSSARRQATIQIHRPAEEDLSSDDPDPSLRGGGSVKRRSRSIAPRRKIHRRGRSWETRIGTAQEDPWRFRRYRRRGSEPRRKISDRKSKSI